MVSLYHDRALRKNFGQHIPTKFKFWTAFPHKIQILDSMSPQNSNFGQHVSTKFKFYQHHNKWEWKHTIWSKIQVQFQAKYKSNFKQTYKSMRHTCLSQIRSSTPLKVKIFWNKHHKSMTSFILRFLWLFLVFLAGLSSIVCTTSLPLFLFLACATSLDGSASDTIASASLPPFFILFGRFFFLCNLQTNNKIYNYW